MRKERDSMGEMEVPEDALYGASTQRAVLNFPISDLRLSDRFIQALGYIKLGAAKSNNSLGFLNDDKAEPIVEAAREVIDGKLNQHFVVDVFQTGSGTSSNMNANEVIANRAIEIIDGERGSKVIHPNDHVNMSQSSNDVIPTAMHISSYAALEADLIPALTTLKEALEEKAGRFAGVIKSGRTHLQDATPVTLGQEFGGFAAQIEKGVERVRRAQVSLAELALGGTAVGTGLNSHPDFPKRAIDVINEETGLNFREADNHFEAQGARDAIVELSGQLRTIAGSMMKIADDIRWMAAGPRCSLSEIRLPEIQPGSSIMPAKVNPVICESVMMVVAHVTGNDTCVSLAGQRGNLELNVMLPVMAYNILQSIALLSTTSTNFVDKCITGIEANEEVCAQYAESSLATCTSLAPIIGYDKAAEVAKVAFKEGLTVREAALKLAVLPEDELDKALDLMAMTKPYSS